MGADETRVGRGRVLLRAGITAVQAGLGIIGVALSAGIAIVIILAVAGLDSATVGVSTVVTWAAVAGAVVVVVGGLLAVAGAIGIGASRLRRRRRGRGRDESWR